MPIITDAIAISKNSINKLIETDNYRNEVDAKYECLMTIIKLLSPVRLFKQRYKRFVFVYYTRLLQCVIDCICHT